MTFYFYKGYNLHSYLANVKHKTFVSSSSAPRRNRHCARRRRRVPRRGRSRRARHGRGSLLRRLYLARRRAAGFCGYCRLQLSPALVASFQVMPPNIAMAPVKLDIDELIADYARENSMTLADFKRVWKAKKFSHIYEGRPRTNSGFFMQSLFLHCIGHLTSESSLPRRLAGLYCLYYLYECQPYRPQFKIYMSLEECRQLKDLIVMAKQNGVHLVPVLVKRMLDKGMFLFGYMNLLVDDGEKQVEELTAMQNKRVKFACDKLFTNTKAESYMHMDLGAEFELDSMKKLSKEYAEAKELSLAEASQMMDVADVKHLLQSDQLLGDKIDEVVKEWDAQKEEFYERTGLSPGNDLSVIDNDDYDGFDEIAQLLG